MYSILKSVGLLALFVVMSLAFDKYAKTVGEYADAVIGATGLMNIFA